MNRQSLRVVQLSFALAGVIFIAQDVRSDESGGSFMARAMGAAAQSDPEDNDPHALRDTSMFAVAPKLPRAFNQHDLIQIIVREASTAESTQELETQKKYSLDGKVSAFPDLSLHDLLNLQAYAGRTVGLPEVEVDGKKKFDGDGDYKREDELTARLTAEVIEVLPNGNLVLEARTHISTDKEESTIRLTGMCRPLDVTAANTVLSSQLHDLSIEKMNDGELRKSAEKGILAKFLDALFAF